LARDGALVIVSDHGNAEVMMDADGQPNTNHSTNPVPFAVVAGPRWIAGRRLAAGGLEDVAPTVLDLMELPIPNEMTGQSLLRRERDFDA
jgi:2,3-bisphosphoglycerate-independent phosphoglycerate mutase